MAMMWLFLFAVLINVLSREKMSMLYNLLMINSLQIILHLPLLRIVHPSHVIMTMAIVFPIVCFDFLEPLENWGISMEDLLPLDI